jgi:hypothetical protein
MTGLPREVLTALSRMMKMMSSEIGESGNGTEWLLEF